MLTNKRMVGFYATRLRLEWDMPWEHFLRAEHRPEGLLFRDNSSTDYDRPLRIPEESTRKWFAEEIDK